MAYREGSDNEMRPQPGDTTIVLPITFDYNGGRSENSKTKVIWGVIISIIGTLVGIGTMTSSDGFFILNIAMGIAILFCVSIVIRFFIFKEHKVRNRYAKMSDSDYKMEENNIWGIYSMDNEYPYYAHLRNGKTALYVLFQKDVVLGKYTDAEFEHYEAISDAYNLLGASKYGICQVDYMDLIGSDERLDQCFQSLAYIKNPDIRDVLTDIYTNLQESMNERVSTFDVYAFTFTGNESTFWQDINQVISCFLEANYVGFRILSSDDLRDLTKTLFNVHDFSTIKACSTAFSSNKNVGVVPIKVTYANGEEIIINKTSEELKEEKKLREKEKMALEDEKKRRKESKKNKKKKKKSSRGSVEDEEIDLFK